MFETVSLHQHSVLQWLTCFLCTWFIPLYSTDICPPMNYSGSARPSKYQTWVILFIKQSSNTYNIWQSTATNKKISHKINIYGVSKPMQWQFMSNFKSATCQTNSFYPLRNTFLHETRTPKNLMSQFWKNKILWQLLPPSILSLVKMTERSITN